MCGAAQAKGTSVGADCQHGALVDAQSVQEQVDEVGEEPVRGITFEMEASARLSVSVCVISLYLSLYLHQYLSFYSS